MTTKGTKVLLRRRFQVGSLWIVLLCLLMVCANGQHITKNNKNNDGNNNNMPPQPPLELNCQADIDAYCASVRDKGRNILCWAYHP
jgi:hypothetical protein